MGLSGFNQKKYIYNLWKSANHEYDVWGNSVQTYGRLSSLNTNWHLHNLKQSTEMLKSKPEKEGNLSTRKIDFSGFPMF